MPKKTAKKPANRKKALAMCEDCIGSGLESPHKMCEACEGSGSV